MKVHVCYSKPASTDKLGVTYDSEGHVTVDLLKQLGPPSDFDFYLCGPLLFMNSLYSGLIGMGVDPDRILYESFGPTSVLKPQFPKRVVEPVGQASPASIRVQFVRSGVEAAWLPANGTLLEFAEEVGLAPAFGCRSGICGSCTTRIAKGAVDYLEEPLAPRSHDEVLICCSIPRQTPGGDGQAPELILDL